MTVILGTAYEALPGKAAALGEVFVKGTSIAARLGANVHALQGYIGAPATLLTSVLEFDNYTALAEYTTTREEDREWGEFISLAMAAPVGQFVRSFDATEVPGLETSEKLKSGAIHTTLLDPIPDKLPTLISQLQDIKEAHEKEGARVHVMRQTTGELNGKLSYICEFDNVIELGKFADKLERNMPYQDVLAKISAEPACAILRSASYKSIK
jgi:hypothetical protein